MDLFQRMKDIMGGGVGVFDVRMQIIDFRCVGIFGAARVEFVARDEIIFSSKHCDVVLKGENLKIARCENGETYVEGDVESVEKIKK